MDRVERIKSMEAAMNESREAVDQLSEAIACLVDVMDELRDLSSYYGSQEWFKDREAEARGKLPEDLACGVLTEDLPYEVLVDAREAALGAIEAATATLRSL